MNMKISKEYSTCHKKRERNQNLTILSIVYFTHDKCIIAFSTLKKKYEEPKM